MTTSPSDEFLADLEQVLKDQGVEPDKARAAAVAIGVQWGGQSVYIRLRGLYLARAIAAAFDGSNAGELATRFRVSQAAGQGARRGQARGPPAGPGQAAGNLTDNGGTARHKHKGRL